MTGAIVILLALLAGAALGNRLAARGVTAQNALVGRQVLAYTVLLGAAAAAFLLFAAPRLAWLPTAAVLYGEAASMHAARALAGFGLALLVALELPGRRDPKRCRQMVLGAVVLAVLAGFLGFRSLPLRIVKSWVFDGVVMQTTAYTCAPSSIATLVRWYGSDTSATEASVTALAGTTREGTNTLAEVRAMRRLGLAPRYVRGLTASGLLAEGHPALLHVDEPVATGVTIRHAVALLAVDSTAGTVVLGNPLHGRQVMRMVQLRGYWTGEAVFVTSRPLRRVT